MKRNKKNPACFKISACTITKNEEKVLARSISSYKEFVDEVIIVDTGSTDDTVKIAEDLGAKVYHFDWCDDFSAAKNFALSKATGDWIVFLDADEYFAANTAENLKATILGADLQGSNAIGCRMEHIDMDTGVRVSDGFSIRAFHSGMCYVHPIHEEIHYSGGIRVMNVDKSYYYLKHTGYSSKLLKKKCERNLTLMLDEVSTCEDEHRRIVLYSYISDSYYGMDEHQKAREYAEMFIEQSKGKNVTLVGCEGKPYMNIVLGLEGEKADPQLIDRYVKEFEAAYPDCAEAYFEDARNLFRRRLFGDALQSFNKALELSARESNTYVDTVCTNLGKVYLFCGLCEEGLQHKSSAMDWYYKAFKETENFHPAMFNLFRIVRDLPQNQIDSFVISMFKTADQDHKLSIITGLMCNYMESQLIDCYAMYRSENKETALNSTITAFIMAGQGKYTEAADLFYYTYTNSTSGKEDSKRCLLCAVLSADQERIGRARSICCPAHAAALEIKHLPNQISAADLFDIASIYVEGSRLGKIDFVTEKINTIAKRLEDKQLIRLSEFLAEEFAFECALVAIRQASITAETVFLQGYCLYRMCRLNEAEALFALAKRMGYEKPDFDEVTGAITTCQEKKENAVTLSKVQEEQLKGQIEQELAVGNVAGASADIDRYMQAAKPDAELFALQAVLFFYTGEYKGAAVAVECGLLKDENNVDLLYNGGCIYEKLGDLQRAKTLYSAALTNCADDALCGEIRQSMAMVEVT